MQKVSNFQPIFNTPVLQCSHRRRRSGGIRVMTLVMTFSTYNFNGLNHVWMVCECDDHCFS